MHARYGAARSAALLCKKFALALLGGIIGEGNARVTPLLRAVVHQALFANVKITGAGPASPMVLAAGGDIVLKTVHAREGTLAERHDFLEDFAFARAQRLQLAVAVVKDADRRGESQFNRATRDAQSVLGIAARRCPAPN